MAGNKRITVRLTEADRKFLHTAGGGGGRGAIQAGFDMVMKFARLMPRTFATLLSGAVKVWRDVDGLANMTFAVDKGKPGGDYSALVKARTCEDGSVHVVDVIGFEVRE